jgi:hypothetical protein
VVVAVTTEPRAPRRKRASKRTLRILAWTAGALSFAASGTAIGLLPGPQPAAAASKPQPQVIVVHKTIKRIVWQQAAPVAGAPKVQYVYVNGGGGGGSTPPVATSCGSHPC